MKPTFRQSVLPLMLTSVLLVTTGCDRRSSATDTNTGANTNTANSALTTDEQNFAKTAAESGLYEVTVAKLAADKAQDADVKAFATTMVDDHTKANTRLASAVNSRMSLPTAIPVDKQKAIDRLNKLSGADFDREFVKTVGLQDHQTDISLFDGAQNTVKDSALRDFVLGSLPTLRHHLSMAQDLAKKLGVGT